MAATYIILLEMFKVPTISVRHSCFWRSSARETVATMSTGTAARDVTSPDRLCSLVI
jgi:hypothetical protein